MVGCRSSATSSSLPNLATLGTTRRVFIVGSPPSKRADPRASKRWSATGSRHGRQLAGEASRRCQRPAGVPADPPARVRQNDAAWISTRRRYPAPRVEARPATDTSYARSRRLSPSRWQKRLLEQPGHAARERVSSPVLLAREPACFNLISLLICANPWTSPPCSRAELRASARPRRRPGTSPCLARGRSALRPRCGRSHRTPDLFGPGIDRPPAVPSKE